MLKLSKWEQIVIKAILLQTDFPVSEVNELESIKSMIFNHQKYISVVSYIKDKDWEGLRNIADEDTTGFREYLEVVKFSDQSKQKYVATIYDNDDLVQDPQIIDIFILG